MLHVHKKSVTVKEGNGHLEGTSGGGVANRGNTVPSGGRRRGSIGEENNDESDAETGLWHQRCRPWACTMEMFSMLKHSMGSDDVNPITKYFSIGKQTGSAGVEMVWKIYEAVRTEDKKVGI